MNHPFFRTRHGGIEAAGAIDPVLIDAVAIGLDEPEEVAFGGCDDDVRWVKFIAPKKMRYIFRSVRVADRPGAYLGAFAVLYRQEEGQTCKRAGVELRTMDGDFVIGVSLEEDQVCYVACSELDDGMLRSYEVQVAEDDPLDIGLNVAYSEASPLWVSDHLSADSLQIGIAAPRRHVQTPRPGVDCVFVGWTDAAGEPIVLEPDVDYEVAAYYANASDAENDWVDEQLESFPTACGEYVVELRGKGLYHGFVRELFRVVRDSGDEMPNGPDDCGGYASSTLAIQARIMANKVAKGFDETSVEEELLLLHGELSEFFDAYRRGDGNVAEELADVAIYTLSIAAKLGIDLGEAVCAKVAVNESRTYHRVGAAFVKDDICAREE